MLYIKVTVKGVDLNKELKVNINLESSYVAS